VFKNTQTVFSGPPHMTESPPTLLQQTILYKGDQEKSSADGYNVTDGYRDIYNTQRPVVTPHSSHFDISF